MKTPLSFLDMEEETIKKPEELAKKIAEELLICVFENETI